MKPGILTHTKAQSTMEYVFIATLVMTGVIIMGPYVIRGINAPFKIMDDSVKDSFSEDLSQDTLDPGYDIPCRCTLLDQCGGPAGTCTILERISGYSCTPPGCMRRPVECNPDPTCCTGWVPGNCGSSYPTPSGEITRCLPTQKLYRRQCGTGPGLPDPNYSYKCEDDSSCITCQTPLDAHAAWCPDADVNLTEDVLPTYVDYGTTADPAANCDPPAMNTKCQGYCKYPYVPSTDQSYCICQPNLAKLGAVTVTRSDGTTDPNAANIIDENVSTMVGASPLCADHPWSLNAVLPFPQSPAHGIQVVATLNYGHNDPSKGTRRISIYTKNAAGAETLRWNYDITNIPQAQWGDYGIEQLSGGAFRITVKKPAAQTWDITEVRVYAEVEQDNSTNQCALPGQMAPQTKNIYLHEVGVWANTCPAGYTTNSDCSCRDLRIYWTCRGIDDNVGNASHSCGNNGRVDPSEPNNSCTPPRSIIISQNDFALCCIRFMPSSSAWNHLWGWDGCCYLPAGVALTGPTRTYVIGRASAGYTRQECNTNELLIDWYPNPGSPNALKIDCRKLDTWIWEPGASRKYVNTYTARGDCKAHGPDYYATGIDVGVDGTETSTLAYPHNLYCRKIQRP